MDGFAVRAADTLGASTYNPISLALIGQSLPGSPASVEVASGEAVRIMTGAPVPAGANAVLPAECADESGNCVSALEALPEGKHVGEIGEDIRIGTTILAAGRQLRPQDVGVLIVDWHCISHCRSSAARGNCCHGQ